MPRLPLQETQQAEVRTHPAAEIFPMMPEDELRVLADDIAANGLREPITVDASGAILDGRNRYRACLLASVEPRYRTWEGQNGDAVAYVLSLNLHRRHMDESQRSMVAGRVANLTNGRPSLTAPIGAVSQTEAADLLGIGRRSVQRAREVLENGAAEVVAAVDNGTLAVSVASDLAQASPEVQRQILAKGKPKEVSKAARLVGRQARAAKKKPKAAAEELTLSAPPSELPVIQAGEEQPDYVTLDQWKAMTRAERAGLLELRATGKTLNRQGNASIEWAQHSWNPVTGCRHDCPYCYARDIANRYYEPKFEPSLWPGRFGMPQQTKVPKQAADDVAFRNVFTCSMADLFGRWVPKEWIIAVLSVVTANPQWNFLFLTKFPKRYAEFDFPKNAWLGTTVDCQARVKSAEEAFENIGGGTKWLSVEPMLEPLKFTRLEMFDWVVIGGASPSSQTPAWVPPIDWVADLHVKARAAGCRIYYKDNCGMLDPLRIREFPWEDPKPTILPEPFRYLAGLE